MPAPTTLDELFDLVRRSGVVDEARLHAYLEKASAEAPFPDDLTKAAGLLVRDGILTHFQAEQFLLGKWRRFTIGKYKVLERLGSGGMGSVYLCEHIFMRRRVAVKVLPTTKSEDSSAIERFYREARAVAALDHPNIVRAYDIDQDEGLHFLVMEYIDGASLQEVVKRHGALDPLRAAHYIKQSAQGLQHAHLAAGLIHRDIKPGNILVDRKGVVKILDLGLARFFHDEEAPITQKFDENVLGTADYLAPEQALDSHNVDVRADIYSLGATFYFCLTGNTPFEGTVAQKLIWHQTRQPRPVRSLRPEIPEELAQVLEKMMAKDPAQRYSNPGEVIAALNPWTQEEIPPPPEHEMPRLSPAALGTVGSDSGTEPFTPPSSVPAPSSRRWQGKPPLSAVPRSAVNSPSEVKSRVGSATAPAAKASPSGSGQKSSLATRQVDAAASLSWAGTAPETVDASARADTASQSKKRVASQPAAASASALATLAQVVQRRKPPTLVWWIGGGAAAGLLLAILLIKLTRPSQPIRPRGTISRPPMEWIVTHVPQPGASKTVHEALYKTKPGDRVIVKDDVVDTILLEDGRWGKDITIEAAADHPVRWKCPPGGKNGRFIVLRGIENLRLKGFIFDGDNQVQELISISGACPRLILEDVEFEGISRTGVAFWNCGADANHAVSLTRARFKTSKRTESAISFNSSPAELSPLSQNIVVSDSRFEGPFQQAIHFNGPVANVTFRGNRFFRTQNAFLYERAAPLNQLQANIESNTFAEIPEVGLRFQTMPSTSNRSLVRAMNNLFSHVGTLAQADDATSAVPNPPAIQAAGNVRDSSCNEGNISLNSMTMPVKLGTDPNNNAKFLRYESNDPLSHAGNHQKPVGAQPPE
jgi:serine/threonine protein kinase